jgi:hypothetical protein
MVADEEDPILFDLAPPDFSGAWAERRMASAGWDLLGA